MDERTVITIGREFGSGGHEIGMKLAEKLDFEPGMSPVFS